MTVRTLHHYEEVGVLVPSERTEAGHRVYGDADVRPLYRIMALRQLGMSLAEIREVRAYLRRAMEALPRSA